jgi:hypothetical protein
LGSRNFLLQLQRERVIEEFLVRDVPCTEQQDERGETDEGPCDFLRLLDDTEAHTHEHVGAAERRYGVE